MKKLELVKNEGEQSDFFSDFWDEYPRKVAKKMAKKAWDKLSPDHKLAEKIIGALYQQKKVWMNKGQEIQFIPYPATWLNQERWEDEMDLEFELSTAQKIRRALEVV